MGWTRLQVLGFRGGISYQSSPGDELAGVAASLLRRPTIRLHPKTLLCDARPRVSSFVEYLGELHLSRVLPLEEMQEGSMVLVVETEEERKEAEAAVEELEQRWRSKYVVHLKP